MTFAFPLGKSKKKPVLTGLVQGVAPREKRNRKMISARRRIMASGDDEVAKADVVRFSFDLVLAA